jgi:hypothetical protein
VRIGAQIKLIEKIMVIKVVAGRGREITSNVQPFSSISGLTTETGKGFQAFKLAHNQRAVRPRAGERNIQMITVFLRRKAAFAAGPGAPSAVSQLRKAETERLKRPPVDLVSYQTSCQTPSTSCPIFLLRQIAKARRCLLALFYSV